MKKHSLVCLLATSVLALSQLAIADSIDATKICPSLLEIQKLPLKTVEPANGNSRFNVSTDHQYQDQSGYDRFTNTYNYKYISYTFSVEGIKASDAEDASQKVKTALATAAAQQPTAIRVEPSFYHFNCIYSLDFSQFGDEYNGVLPVAIAEIYGTDAQNLYAVPKNLNIRK